ncbi:MAG: dUTP diphosphatase [Ignavibacteriaceae bacterium]
MIELKFKRINPLFADIPLPEYTTEGSAGMDIRAAIEGTVVVEAGDILLIPTNLSVEIPEGFELQVRPRSGLALKHGLGILNSPGTIDADYRGEIKIIIFNFGKKPIHIKKGDRIAQLVLTKYYRANVTENKKLNKSKRGSGGFGHSGLG